MVAPVVVAAGRGAVTQGAKIVAKQAKAKKFLTCLCLVFAQITTLIFLQIKYLDKIY